MLSAIFGYAVEAGYIKASPVAQIPKQARRKQPKRSPDRLRYWTSDQAASLYQATANDRLHALYVLALTIGLRRGELAGLQWRDLDLRHDGGTLKVSRQLVTIGYAVHEQSPKTERSARTINLDPTLAATLRAHRKAQAAEQLAWQEVGDWKGDGRGWVFTAENGAPLHPQSIANKLAAAAKRAGLPWIGVHGLRHTCAVLALEAGVPMKVVSNMLAHESITVTSDLYMHVTPGMEQGAVASIGQLLRSVAE
jgi:integrase